MKMNHLSHSFDLSLDRANDAESLTRASYFSEFLDGNFDCAGTLGSAGSWGGTLGTVGTFGCCC